MTETNITIETLAGQRLMAGFDGTDLDDELKFLIHDLRVGGIILFTRNVVDSSQVARLCKNAQAFASRCNCPPLFVAIDQEGGQVARLKRPMFREFEGTPAITSPEKATLFGEEMAILLKGLHLNMNLAPVMDTVPPEFEGIMTQRVFQGSPDTVAALGMGVINALQAQGIMAVAKHFPGIGRTTLDSHLHLPVLETPGEELMHTDLIPFKAAINGRVSGIMLSHILYTGLDSQWPASLSVKIAGTLLRDQLGYDGIVMTDDLDMKAITYDIPTAIQRILKARIDMFLICHSGPDIEAAIVETRKWLDQDETMYKHGLTSMRRILNTKRQYLEPALWPVNGKKYSGV